MYNTSHLKDGATMPPFASTYLSFAPVWELIRAITSSVAAILHKILLKMKTMPILILDLKDADVVADALLLVLSYAFGNPGNVADFLFSELYPSVDNGVSELPGESLLGNLHLLLVKHILQGLGLTSAATHVSRP